MGQGFKMNWDKLLSGVRLRQKMVSAREINDGRNDFDDDYSRLIFSSSIRRLQDKAQVFPLDSSDFVRTRLTHSHEVSAIGRSLGSSIEKVLIKDEKLNVKHSGKISSLLATAGLIHDLGNPPYGHYGESAIQTFFKRWFYDDNNKHKKNLTVQQIADFENFEGNAQTFRLLTKLHNLKHDSYGYNLSAATLATIIKYPRSSTEGNKNNENMGTSFKKFGYLQSEKDRFDLVKKFTGIGDFRHPLTFLLEASDDIAYSAADIEDGCKKGVLDYTTIKEILDKHLSNGSDEDKILCNYFHSVYEENKVRTDRLDNTVQKFRIQAQGFMIKSVTKKFVQLHDKILEGKFDEDILLASEAANIRLAFKDLSKIIFKDNEIQVRELAGGTVIQGLLQKFVTAVLSSNCNEAKTEDGKLYSLISSNYRDIMELVHKKHSTEPSTYERLLLVTDFICGMTDTYALEYYRRLAGIKL
ncbi:dGTP triphosphohydrolase [Bacillus sp. RAR_M1_44]|uniref:dGTP triphosphohydrolase n=1 Tax=Bacillus sp. RAR_M1_44 TaxID=2876776 RepID=UPI001CC8FE2F|nr:dNTP triphosphohydrolase [Bacillus sp. RAR_M1_44]MCA0164458.1 dNTP triphosphohydrolase [Bacillus sp. RAR_M1_44]